MCSALRSMPKGSTPLSLDQGNTAWTDYAVFFSPPNIFRRNDPLLFESLIQFAHELKHSLRIKFLGRFFGDLTPGTCRFRRRIL